MLFENECEVLVFKAITQRVKIHQQLLNHGYILRQNKSFPIEIEYLSKICKGNLIRNTCLQNEEIDETGDAAEIWFDRYHLKDHFSSFETFSKKSEHAWDQQFSD